MPNRPHGAVIDSVYRSYLVRFWQSDEQGSWRASVQCVQTGSTILFGDIESLFSFFQGEIGLPASEESNKEEEQ